MTEGLSCAGLALGYRGRQVLSGIDAVIPPGRFTVLCGPNGSGKSTLLRALSGYLPPSAGKVLLDGRALGGWAPRARARRLALLPQGPGVPEGMRVLDLVSAGRAPHRGLLAREAPGDGAAILAALAQTGLADLALHPLESLSGGQRQRAWIAMTLAQQSDILLLDEPTAFLDLPHQLEVLALIRSLVAGGRTVVAVLHDLNQALACADHLLVLHAGALVASGAPAGVLTAAVLRDVFGVEVTLLRDPVSGQPVMSPRLPR